MSCENANSWYGLEQCDFESDTFINPKHTTKHTNVVQSKESLVEKISGGRVTLIKLGKTSKKEQSLSCLCSLFPSIHTVKDHSEFVEQEGSKVINYVDYLMTLHMGKLVEL
jgi:hypothetical protein